MSPRNTTTRTISAADLDPEIRRLIREAGEGSIQLAVVENGATVAVVMPPQSAQQWSMDRQRFFDTIREMQAAADLTPEEADELAREAVEAVRSRTR